MRYLQTVVAWIHTIISLNQSKLFRSGLGLTLNIVHTPSSPNTGRMLPMQNVLDELLPLVTTIESHDVIRTALLAMLKSPTSDKFSGTVHCEAMLMVLATACSAPNSTLTGGLVELLGVNSLSPLILTLSQSPILRNLTG
jgi:hypothetical protein